MRSIALGALVGVVALVLVAGMLALIAGCDDEGIVCPRSAERTCGDEILTYCERHLDGRVVEAWYQLEPQGDRVDCGAACEADEEEEANELCLDAIAGRAVRVSR